MSRETLYSISAVFFIAVIGFVTLPFSTRLIDKIEPRFLGMPFMQFCMLASTFALAVWLFIWLALECRIEDKAVENEEKEVTGR